MSNKNKTEEVWEQDLD